MDLARSEAVEAEQNRLIEKRSTREMDPDEREELWQESLRAYTARRREEMRAVLEELIADHEEQAEKYYRQELEMSRRKSTKKVRERRRSLKNVKARRQINGRKAGATDRGRVKGMGIGGWA